MILIDTVAPSGTVELFPDSESGIWGFPATMSDGITSYKTPLLYGATEANALVRAAIDGVAAGTAVAIPYDGNDAFPPPPGFDGNYFLQTILMLADGEHTIEDFFQDVAGNESPADDDATLVDLRRYGRAEDHERDTRPGQPREHLLVRWRDEPVRSQAKRQRPRSAGAQHRDPLQRPARPHGRVRGCACAVCGARQ